MNSMYDYYNYMNNLDNYNNNNYDFNGLNNISGINNMSEMYKNKSDDILDPYTAFIRGNSFNSLYDPYKNFMPDKINIKNEKEELLLQIQELAFIMNDIALYLDIKEDINMVNMFNNYSKKKEELCKKYESKYGPLKRNYYMYQNWKWDNSPWPWEGSK